MGPVQVLVVGFDRPTFSGEVLAELTRLREAGIVRLVDLLLLSRAEDGTFETLATPDGANADLGGLAAAVLGWPEGEANAESVLDAGSDDLTAWSLADAVPPGSAVAVALIEHIWATPLTEAIQRAGGNPLEETWLAPGDLEVLEALIVQRGSSRAWRSCGGGEGESPGIASLHRVRCPRAASSSVATASKSWGSVSAAPDPTSSCMRARDARTASRRVRARVRPASSGAEASSAVSRSSTAETRLDPTAQPPATCSADPGCRSSGMSTRANQATSSSAAARSAIHARRRRARTRSGTATATASATAARSHHNHEGAPVVAEDGPLPTTRSSATVTGSGSESATARSDGRSATPSPSDSAGRSPSGSGSGFPDVSVTG